LRRWRNAFARAALTGLFAAGGGHAADAPTDADITKRFAAQIARLDALDPRAPAALEAHLRYAGYLASQPLQNCGARLDAAQSQLNSAQQNVALSVVLPQGTARAADVGYQIHTARAACGDAIDAARRQAQLLDALDCAQRAAALYRDSFDYPAMLTMQFNAAVTRQSLGDTAAAQAALKSVIQADREFGFRDDAEENYELLRSWSNRDAQPSALQDFPQRTVTLKFAWAPGEDAVTLQSQSARVVGDAVVHARGDRSMMRSVLGRPFGWSVTYRSLGSHYALEPLPAGSDVGTGFMISLAAMLTQFHDFTLGKKSHTPAATATEFNELIDDSSFEARARQEVNTPEIGSALSGDAPTSRTGASLARVLGTALDDLLYPTLLAATTELDYNLETGAWPDATLQQGQWYGMEFSMPLPFAPRNFVLYQVQFAFTRELPCTPQADRTCVELVLRAMPEEKDLDSTLGLLQRPLHLRRGQTLHCASTMYMRLVTDPATLQAYHRDLRQFFYVAVDGAAKSKADEALLGADQSSIDYVPAAALSDAAARRQ
jgi:hypothetical protein